MNNARFTRRMGQLVVVMLGVVMVAVAVARLPAPGRESGSWDYVDAAGNVIGQGWMDCSGQITNWGSTNGRFANIEIFRCN
ncbi:hypothetical protein ABB30_01025 [Stenotrophomonas ginsengisoli]|uniref:Uncharacterized protein n=1 Tax=Stenotrophomonas ginsengisoli TaxID=336566 RepID=A0A0R0DAV2_9GAMM|nr:DUF6289 family protein [Stenotrophomonas ginsengisoli]KRG79391.1 hypothetical protein ABB30_01025 [Stenotrophomonas ginsengisoli]